MVKSTSRRARSKTKAVRPTPAGKAAAGRRPAGSGKSVKASVKAPGKAKWVYRFGNGKAEGRAGMRDLLGGKGAGLAEMANLGLPVPPGFTITTAVCTQFYANNKRYPDGLRAQVDAALLEIGRITGKGFGDGSNPLLVSVRSGGRASMPGMMDTVLNLGLN
ncbi:MAG: PEP/pyruvate-binding domain-containing protein, partial [Xanthobacteraceae bacterium]